MKVTETHRGISDEDPNKKSPKNISESSKSPRPVAPPRKLGKQRPLIMERPVPGNATEFLLGIYREQISILILIAQVVSFGF